MNQPSSSSVALGLNPNICGAALSDAEWNSPFSQHGHWWNSILVRDALLQRAGVEKLPHRSKECSPCVNANRSDFLRLTPGEVERVNDLEVEIARPMFRAKRFGALGIHGVMKWAKDGRDRPSFEDEEESCSGLFGCGT